VPDLRLLSRQLLEARDVPVDAELRPGLRRWNERER